MFALVAKAMTRFEGFQVLCFVCELEAEAATYKSIYTIAVIEDFAFFNRETLLHSPFLSYRWSSRLLPAKTSA